MILSPLSNVLLGCLHVQTAPSTYSLDTTAKRVAFGFILPEDKTLDSVSLYLSAAISGLGANDIVCEIRSSNSSSAYYPTATVLATSSTCSPSYNGAGMYTWSGLNCSLTAGTMYFAVFKNVNATPATAYWNVM